MAVERAEIREVAPPTGAPFRRESDGATIRYFESPDGRVGGFVYEAGDWTQVSEPKTPDLKTEALSRSAPAARQDPPLTPPTGIGAQEVRPSPGAPVRTPTGDDIHWFVNQTGVRAGFVRSSNGWRLVARESPPVEPSETARNTEPPVPPPWMAVDAGDGRSQGPSPDRVAADSRPRAAARPGIRGWAATWWEEAGRNSRAKRASVRSEAGDRSTDAPPKDDAGDERPRFRALQRRRRLAHRLLIGIAALGIALVVLTVVGDFISAVRPAPQRIERVVEAGSGNSLSSEQLAAATFAVQFTWAYLTYDGSNPQEHANAVAPFLGSNVTDTWDGSGTQTVATAEAESVHSASSGMESVSVAAYVASYGPTGEEQLRWLYLRIPIQVNGSQMSVAGMPATVPPPQIGAPSGDILSPSVSNEDTTLTQQLTGPVRSFFEAWSGASGTQLSYLESPLAKIQPLGPSQQKFEQLASFQVAQGGGHSRTSLASVTWADAVTGAQFTQPYTVGWSYSGSRWLISSVKPGAS